MIGHSTQLLAQSGHHSGLLAPVSVLMLHKAGMAGLRPYLETGVDSLGRARYHVCREEDWEGCGVARPRTGRPTDGELEILNVLWERGPCTAGEVRDAIAHARPVSYNTVQKALQIMADKRLVSVDASQRAHVFRAREPRSIVVSRMVKDLVRRALGGSTSQLLLHALEGKRATREELEEMRRLLGEAERQERRK
jgi:BlaI family penicillinase repressor